MTARLKVARSGQRRPSGSRETTDTFMMVVSVHASTAKAPPGVKQKFADELQDVLGTVPHSDFLILLGDFNAWVGKRDTENSIWSGVIGNLIIDNVNEAGEEFLEFCAIYMYQLTIMNTWFKKKDMHLGIGTVYHATVLAVLLYGAETWTANAEHVKRLNAFTVVVFTPFRVYLVARPRINRSTIVYFWNGSVLMTHGLR